MFGVELSNSEWAGLIGAAVVLLRILFGLLLVLWWYVTDALRPTHHPPAVVVLTGFAVGAMAVSLLSVATGWPADGIRAAAYAVAGFLGWFLGMMFEFVIYFRLWRLSHWLTSFRIPQYRDQLQLGDTDTRLGAARRLASIGFAANPAKPELLAVARGDESADVRSAATKSLLYATPDPPAEDDTDTPRVARTALTDTDPRVRVFAAALLVRFKATPPAEMLPILSAALGDPDAEVVEVAVAAIIALGPAAVPAIPALRDAAMTFEKPNFSAPYALAAIGGPEAVAALVEVLERGNNTARNFAAHALGGMGEGARAALPALQKAAIHPDLIVSESAKKAIKNITGRSE